MVTQLTALEGRVGELEEIIAPIHEITKRENSRRSALDKQIQTLTAILSLYDMHAEAEERIKIGPTADLALFLAAIDKLNQAIATINSSPKIKDSETLLKKLHLSLKKAHHKLESVITTTLETKRFSAPFDSKKYQQLPDKIEIFPDTLLVELSQVAEALDSLKKTDHVQRIVQLRSEWLQASLFGQNSEKIVESEDSSVRYKKGSHFFVHLLHLFLLLVEHERSLLLRILPASQHETAFSKLVNPSLERLLECGRSLSKKKGSDRIFVLLDVLQKFEELSTQYSHTLALGGPDKYEQITLLQKTIMQQSRKMFEEFVHEVSGDTSHTLTDGTTHTHTINTLSVLTRLCEYVDVCSPLLVQEHSLNSPFSLYMARVVSALVENIQQQKTVLISKKEKEPSSLSLIFQLNNYHHILSSFSTSPLSEHLAKDEKTRYNRLLDDSLKTYLNITWSRALSAISLKDDEKKMPDKKELKAKFSSFNTEFEAITASHTHFVVPHRELKDLIIQSTLGLVIPQYSSFRHKYASTPFCKNMWKYDKYKSEDIEHTINSQFFAG
eukprot:TRINITY_DN3852_c0_g1_i1.p1 TRINITY_DN3852_c0_g1~~TRINITY_DN3852_c0_g1_i1.p1  ORF type:complete len:592 (+),score=166.10 TRINITY_DN3852_c0_g1_i1:112-1776(+)